ncbi:MAG: hypothetical protein IKW76_03945 [Clostridia bacterium]|nr:hypothetical protein [Clostridia bacterium]
MRKVLILCCSILLCFAICFPVYADLVVPFPPGNPTNPSRTTTNPQEAPTTVSEGPSSPIIARLQAVWGAVIAAVLAAVALLTQFFHKKG